MEVAITGASGLIGSALARSLRADGHTVRPLVRPASSDGERGTDAIRWDPAAGTIEKDALDGIDAVVHLAGAGIGDKRWSPARKREIGESRAQGTDLLARTLAGLSHPPAVFVSGSAVGYYGDRGDEELTEAVRTGGGFPRRGGSGLGGGRPAGGRCRHPTVFLRIGVVLVGRGRQLPGWCPCSGSSSADGWARAASG